MTRTTFQEEANKLRAKLQASERYVPITEEEYHALQVRQFCELDRRAQENFRPDLSRLGLHESELQLTWKAVKPGVSDGDKARVEVEERYRQGYGMIFLSGTYGQGKTLIGKILIATAHRDGKRAAYANVSAVLDDIRLAFDEPEHKTTELLRRMEFWSNRDALFLDELDKANDTAWAQERIFELLDKRYTLAIREEALTVIASNGDTGALSGYLKSRLHDRRFGGILHLNGADGRQSAPDGWKF